MSDYHEPVLLKASIDYLLGDPNGIYVDVTFGGGGHSREILSRLTSKGKLVVFDQDDDARKNSIEDARLEFVESNFRYIYRFWKWLDLPQVDGVLADLGVSSHQFDVESRGFSYRFDALLDMRMNQMSEKTAADILNNYDAHQLKQIFSRYGELRNAGQLARKIVAYRSTGNSFETSRQLNALLDQARIGDKHKYYAQVYQALRIEVNDEIGALKEMLQGAFRILKPGGRLVVMSYHSLEDRIVKRFFKSGNFEGHVEKDLYGRSLVKIKAVNGLIVPDETERSQNARSRSAKMRIAEKIMN